MNIIQAKYENAIETLLIVCIRIAYGLSHAPLGSAPAIGYAVAEAVMDALNVSKRLVADCAVVEVMEGIAPAKREMADSASPALHSVALPSELRPMDVRRVDSLAIGGRMPAALHSVKSPCG